MATMNATERTIIADAARRADLDPAALLAVVAVESGGRTSVLVNGRREPLIRFEGHYFDRALSDRDRLRARQMDLASPVAGKIANPRGQAARWAMLNRAIAIDRTAALQAVSWGVGQVMGAHWQSLGYTSVDALVETARSGLEGQLAIMTAFIRKNGLAGYLERQDWAGFARRYNGPAYRRNRYDTKLRAAHERFKGLAPPGRQRELPDPSVEELQQALTASGFPVAASGIMDEATRKAVRAFQTHAGIRADGIAGPVTWQHLRRRTNPDNRFSSGWLVRLLLFIARWTRRA